MIADVQNTTQHAYWGINQTSREVNVQVFVSECVCTYVCMCIHVDSAGVILHSQLQG